MIVSSNTPAATSALRSFLSMCGVSLPVDEEFRAIGRLNADSALCAVVGYNGFCGRVCMMHVAGVGNWMTREFLWAAFDYPFNQAGLVQVFGCTPQNNPRALKLEKHLGFKTLATIPDGWAEGVDLVLQTMHKSECRWLGLKNARLDRKAA